MFAKTTLFVSLGLVALWLAITAPALLAAPAATTFTVNSNLDEPDADKTDGQCLSAPSGKCTLRAAVMQANASSDANTILLQNATTYTLTLGGAGENKAATGDLDIIYDLTIEGAGVTRTFIDGNDTDRVFHVASTSAKVKISYLTLRDGNVSGVAGEFGGGVFNAGTFVLVGVNITSNNAADKGGGIFNLGGDVTLVDSTVSDNVSEHGGGIYNGSSGKLTILRSTINGNHARDDGGGIYKGSGILILGNSTISGNVADNSGGGIQTFGGNEPTDVVKMFNVTIAFNRSDADDDGDGSGEGGGINQQSGDVYWKNTIIAGNVMGTLAPTPNDCFGYLDSDGYNLIQSIPLYCVILDDGATVKKGLSANLGALANNGGPTFTHALLPVSPAIDAGNPNGCKDQYNGLFTQDQRGQTRHLNGNGPGGTECDLGAFEYNPMPGPTPPPVLCNTKPAAPALVSPANNTHKNNPRVGLDWNDTTCATKYKVLVKQDSKSGPRADKKKVTTSDYKTKTLAKGHTYFWKVTACNTFGCAKSGWRMFTVKP